MVGCTQSVVHRLLNELRILIGYQLFHGRFCFLFKLTVLKRAAFAMMVVESGLQRPHHILALLLRYYTFLVWLFVQHGLPQQLGNMAMRLFHGNVEQRLVVRAQSGIGVLQGWKHVDELGSYRLVILHFSFHVTTL